MTSDRKMTANEKNVKSEEWPAIYRIIFHFIAPPPHLNLSPPPLRSLHSASRLPTQLVSVLRAVISEPAFTDGMKLSDGKSLRIELLFDNSWILSEAPWRKTDRMSSRQKPSGQVRRTVPDVITACLKVYIQNIYFDLRISWIFLSGRVSVIVF